MMTFDMAPLIKDGYKKFLIIPIFGGLPFVLIVYLLGQSDWALALFRGIVIGVVDTVIMIHGIRRAIPYEKEPVKGLAVMRRYRWYRLIAISTFIILLLKQGAAVAGVCIGLLLTHILLIFNLIFIAYRLNKMET